MTGETEKEEGCPDFRVTLNIPAGLEPLTEVPLRLLATFLRPPSLSFVWADAKENIASARDLSSGTLSKQSCAVACYDGRRCVDRGVLRQQNVGSVRNAF